MTAHGCVLTPHCIASSTSNSLTRRYWRLYVQHEVKNKNFAQVQALLNRSLVSCASVPLYHDYLRFMKEQKTGTPEYRKEMVLIPSASQPSTVHASALARSSRRVLTQSVCTHTYKYTHSLTLTFVRTPRVPETFGCRARRTSLRWTRLGWISRRPISGGSTLFLSRTPPLALFTKRIKRSSMSARCARALLSLHMPWCGVMCVRSSAPTFFHIVHGLVWFGGGHNYCPAWFIADHLRAWVPSWCLPQLAVSASHSRTHTSSPTPLHTYNVDSCASSCAGVPIGGAVTEAER